VRFLVVVALPVAVIFAVSATILAVKGDGDNPTAPGQHLRLTGTSGMRVATPDSVPLSITGDIDLRIRCSLDDWTPAANQILLSKYVTTGNQRSWEMLIDKTGRMWFTWSRLGTSTTLSSVKAMPPFVNGVAYWLRVTMDVDVVGKDSWIRFFWSDDDTNDADAVKWKQQGVTNGTGATTSIFDSAAEVAIGGANSGTSSQPVGNFYAAQIRNGIAGTVVASPDFSTGTLAQTDAQGNIWAPYQAAAAPRT